VGLFLGRRIFSSGPVFIREALILWTQWLDCNAHPGSVDLFVGSWVSDVFKSAASFTILQRFQMANLGHSLQRPLD